MRYLGCTVAGAGYDVVCLGAARDKFEIRVNAVVQAGKSDYPLPMFVNAALIHPDDPPGRYNSGGPLPHSFDIWKVGGPHIDFVAPDIYFTNFSEREELYTRAGNPLFIPETYGDARGAANAFYAYGKLDSIGFCQFAIESLDMFGYGENEGSDLLGLIRFLLQAAVP